MSTPRYAGVHAPRCRARRGPPHPGYGVTGAGKSTLAARLSEATGIAWHSVDDLMWEPGWIPVPLEEQRRRIESICAEPEWILDAAYGGWRDVAVRRTQLIVALDYPRWLSFQRLVRRTLIRWARRETVCNGNREYLRLHFRRDGLVLWQLTSFAKTRRRMRRWSMDQTGPPVVRFTAAGQTEAWLAALAAGDDGRAPSP